jgi:nitrite reductase/ring-hydroxylating ferredoxin subunit
MDAGDRKGPWFVKDQASFAAYFRDTNYRFRFFDICIESGGADVDVEFNYKDLAHLEVVHNTFNVFYSYISGDLCSGILLQKLFGLTFPMTHVSIQLSKNHLFFHNSILNIIMTSEVVIEPLSERTVRVKTRYGVGAPRLLLPLAFPLLKRLLTRNFHTLMAGDIPMRNRRGEIRSWGIRISKSSYGFNETLDIRQQRVLPPENDAESYAISVPIASLASNSPLLVGKSNHLGLQIFWRDGLIEVFPRMCPHEGACLDREKLDDPRGISCGWHGRFFRPILRVGADQDGDEFVSSFHRFVISGGTMHIKTLPVVKRTDPVDWTTPAAREASTVPADTPVRNE